MGSFYRTSSSFAGREHKQESSCLPPSLVDLGYLTTSWWVLDRTGPPNSRLCRTFFVYALSENSHLRDLRDAGFTEDVGFKSLSSISLNFGNIQLPSEPLDETPGYHEGPPGQTLMPHQVTDHATIQCTARYRGGEMLLEVRSPRGGVGSATPGHRALDTPRGKSPLYRDIRCRARVSARSSTMPGKHFS